MSQKLVLIDGHSILNRAFYGVPDLSNAEGLHTNAVYGFLNIMFKILEEEKPEYLAVAFDVHAPTFRHQMYEAYKGTRKPMPEELREQVPVMKEVLKAMHITIMEQAGLEADDILGTLAKKAEQAGMEVSLVSGDRDLLQIATDHIKIRIPKTKQGKTEVEDYYAKRVPLKEGVRQYLEEFRERKIPMVIATTGDRKNAEAALSRLKVLSYFQGVFTASEIGNGKDQPDIYFAALLQLDTEPEQTWVFEDTYQALRTAKHAGFKTVAVYDKANDKNLAQIWNTADIYLPEFDDFNVFWNRVSEEEKEQLLIVE